MKGLTSIIKNAVTKKYRSTLVFNDKIKSGRSLKLCGWLTLPTAQRKRITKAVQVVYPEAEVTFFPVNRAIMAKRTMPSNFIGIRIHVINKGEK